MYGRKLTRDARSLHGCSFCLILILFYDSFLIAVRLRISPFLVQSLRVLVVQKCIAKYFSSSLLFYRLLEIVLFIRSLSVTREI